MQYKDEYYVQVEGVGGERRASAEGQHPQGHEDLMNEVSFIAPECSESFFFFKDYIMCFLCLKLNLLRF